MKEISLFFLFRVVFFNVLLDFCISLQHWLKDLVYFYLLIDLNLRFMYYQRFRGMNNLFILFTWQNLNLSLHLYIKAFSRLLNTQTDNKIQIKFFFSKTCLENILPLLEVWRHVAWISTSHDLSQVHFWSRLSPLLFLKISSSCIASVVSFHHSSAYFLHLLDQNLLSNFYF